MREYKKMKFYNRFEITYISTYVSTQVVFFQYGFCKVLGS